MLLDSDVLDVRVGVAVTSAVIDRLILGSGVGVSECEAVLDGVGVQLASCTYWQQPVVISHFAWLHGG